MLAMRVVVSYLGRGKPPNTALAGSDRMNHSHCVHFGEKIARLDYFNKPAESGRCECEVFKSAYAERMLMLKRSCCIHVVTGNAFVEGPALSFLLPDENGVLTPPGKFSEGDKVRTPKGDVREVQHCWYGGRYCLKDDFSFAEGELQLVEKNNIPHSYAIGDKVQVLGGMFKYHIGTVENINGYYYHVRVWGHLEPYREQELSAS